MLPEVDKVALAPQQVVIPNIVSQPTPGPMDVLPERLMEKFRAKLRLLTVPPDQASPAALKIGV